MNQLFAVHVSNRQFNVMREAQQSHGIALARMVQISQITVGGIFRRGFMTWNKKVGMFQLTQSGIEVMKQYQFTDVERKDHHRPLSQYVPNHGSLEIKQMKRKAVA